MKKIFLLFVVSLLLSSCFGGEDQGVDETGLVQYSFSGFSMKLPSNWSQTDSQNLPQPREGEIELAYASGTQREGYINNLVVLSAENRLADDATSFMSQQANFLRSTMSTYTPMSEELLQFQDGEEGKLLIFRGKYNPNTPELIYLQSARICGDRAYSLTLSVAQFLESYDRYAYLLSSFRCE